MTSFAAVAILLSVIGVYGVMGYYVQQHLKEISIRMALGGSQADVARLVVGQGMTVVGIGIAVGVAVALGGTRLMSSLLFNVGASDPSAYAGAGTLLFVVALLACAVPAFRATRLQPASYSGTSSSAHGRPTLISPSSRTMLESPSATAARIDRPSDDHDTRRAMNVARSPKSVS